MQSLKSTPVIQETQMKQKVNMTLDDQAIYGLESGLLSSKDEKINEIIAQNISQIESERKKEFGKRTKLDLSLDLNKLLVKQSSTTRQDKVLLEEDIMSSVIMHPQDKRRLKLAEKQRSSPQNSGRMLDKDGSRTNKGKTPTNHSRNKQMKSHKSIRTAAKQPTAGEAYQQNSGQKQEQASSSAAAKSRSSKKGKSGASNQKAIGKKPIQLYDEQFKTYDLRSKPGEDPVTTTANDNCYNEYADEPENQNHERSSSTSS